MLLCLTLFWSTSLRIDGLAVCSSCNIFSKSLVFQFLPNEFSCLHVWFFYFFSGQKSVVMFWTLLILFFSLDYVTFVSNCPNACFSVISEPTPYHEGPCIHCWTPGM